MKSIRTAVFRLLPKSQFARGVSILVGGTASAQMMMVIAAPLLTRLYTPADFGLLAVFVGLLGLFTVIACLRYELAIPLPEHNQEAANLVVLCLLTVFGVASASALMVWFGGTAIAEVFGIVTLTPYFWLLPAGVMLVGIYQTLTYWAIRTKQFPVIAHTRIRQALATIAIQLVAFKTGGVGLVVGQVGGQGMGSVTLARAAKKCPELSKWSWQGIRNAARRYRRFPLYDVWYGLFFTAGAQLPVILLASLFGPSIAGFYALANRVLAMPMSMVGNAIAQVFLSDAAAAQRDGRLGILLEDVVSKLIHIATPPALVLLVAGPDLFSLVFGRGWELAGSFGRIMSIWIFMQFITAPLTPLFAVMEKQAQGAFFQGLMLMARVSGLLLGFMLDSVMLGVAFFSAGSALGYMLIIVWMITKAQASIRRILRVGLWSLTVSLLSISPLFAFQWFGWEKSGLAICGLLAGTLITVQYVIILKKLQ